MATTQNTFNGNGSNLGPFSFTFKWLESTDIKVSVGGVLKTAGTHYNLQALNYATKTGGQVLFTAGNAPPTGTNNIRVYRDTDDDALSATFSSGSAIRAKDLNDNFTQNLYVTQEVNNNAVNIDGSNPMVGPLNMNGFQITNLPVPAVDTNAATKKYVDDRFGNLDIPGHTRWRKVATNGQTTFSGTGDYGGVLAYSSTREQIYINGALQQRGIDYAADNGTSVVFTVGLTVGDVVDIICVNNLTNSSVSNAGNITYSGQFTGQTARTVAAKLGEAVSVLDFGADPTGQTNSTAAIQAALNAHTCVTIPPGTYNISASIKPNTGQRLIFQGGKLFTTGIITTDECAIKIVDASDVEVWNADIDCNNQPANSGIIVRENTANVRIYNTKVTRAAWDAARGGGRAIIIEAHTGDVGRIIVDGLTATQVDTVIGIFGSASDGMRKNAIVVTNVVAKTANKLIALFGPDSDATPNTADLQQSIISNVVGYDVNLPIRYANGSDAIIDNVYVYNKTLNIGPVIQGFARNVRITNFVMNGTATTLLDASPWLDDNTTPAYTPGANGSRKCHYQLTHRGTISTAVLTSQYTHNGIISDTTLDLNVDTVTTNAIGNAAVNVNTTVYVNLFSAASRARISGYLDAIGTKTISSATLQDYLQSAAFPTGTFTPAIIGATSAGTATYSTAQGAYTKIGNVVFFNCYLTWSGHTGTGGMRVGGLPFTSSATANTQTAVSVSFMDGLALSAGNVLSAYVDVGQTYVVLVQTPAGGGGASTVPLDPAGSVMIAGHYMVD